MAWPHKLSRGRYGRLYLIGPYDEDLVEKIRALPRPWRTWSPSLGAWAIEPEAESAVQELIARHYMTHEQREAWRVRQRLAWCEGRLAALRAEKKVAIRKDWGIG